MVPALVLFGQEALILLHAYGEARQRGTESTLQLLPLEDARPDRTLDIGQRLTGCGSTGRLRHMSDRELLRFGKSARYMCSPAANLGKEPRPVVIIQLREAEKEWRRRGLDSTR